MTLIMITFILASGMILLLTNNILALEPYGTNFTHVRTETAPIDDPQSHNAMAGNVTEITISGYSTTMSWQGYFGNVSGVIQLADDDDNVLYNWTLTTPSGEVYASNNSDVDWTNMTCFNYTRDGLALENAFGINESAVDGINETFKYTNAHDEFYTASQQFSEGDCPAAFMYDGNRAPTDDHFEEVLIWADGTLVYTALLEKDDTTGFDDQYYDFEMIVLEDGHGTDVDITPYYFYVELEYCIKVCGKHIKYEQSKKSRKKSCNSSHT